MNNILEARTQLSNADVIYLDFRKAFDLVPHNELLYKLWKYGITGDLWLWFRAYLSSRTQCVKINGCLSGLLPVVSGVPQGSILGSLLFVLYINDMPDVLSSAIPYLFADDTKCLHMHKHTTSPQSTLNQTLLQNDINALFDYGNSWHLFFNNTMCSHLHFHFNPGTDTPTYYINNMEISKKTETKDLGITFNTNLHWDQHYKNITSRAYI